MSRYPMRLIPGRAPTKDANFTFRMNRLPEAPAAVPLLRLAAWPYVDAFNGDGTLAGRHSDSWHTYDDFGDAINLANTAVADGALRLNVVDSLLNSLPLPPPPSANYYLELLVLSDGWATFENNNFGLYLRQHLSAGGTNYYVAFVFPPSTVRGTSFTYTVAKIIDDAEIDFVNGATAAASIVEGAPFTIRLAVVNDALTLSINGAVEFTQSDSDLTKTGNIIYLMQTDAAADSYNHIAILNAEAGTAT